MPKVNWLQLTLVYRYNKLNVFTDPNEFYKSGSMAPENKFLRGTKVPPNEIKIIKNYWSLRK